MTRVLISTFPKDVHAEEVALALEDQGHEAVLWYASDFPTVQSATLDFRGGEMDWELTGPGLAGARPPFDTVWLRRPTPAVLPPDLHPGDLPVARRECRDFLRGLYHLAAPDAFWVNPLAGRLRADSKAVQLREAQRVGLTIPPTVMSNNPARIRQFLDEIGGRGIYKAFYPAQWNGEERIAVLLTSEITPGDLPEDELLRLTPGIFQARVEKSHELRVTVMGSHVVTARLCSQEVEEAQLDWRAAGAQIQLEPDRLPDAVEAACLRLMRSLGIVFGCFDFIVTPEGEHVFLEVNPSGQFLWVEEANPELQVLAPFVDFLLAGRPDFRWQPSPEAVRHEDCYQAACRRMENLDPRHLSPADSFVGPDEPR
ncbi:MAG TPA: hypothetical protein VGG03_01370 [Thermoanaerobaculia bacterium]|jgi:hypothetical protein